MLPIERGYRLGPLYIHVEEEVESLHLKLLLNPPANKPFSQCVRRFNANIPYSGLLYSVTQEASTLFICFYKFCQCCDFRVFFPKIKRS